MTHVNKINEMIDGYINNIIISAHAERDNAVADASRLRVERDSLLADVKRINIRVTELEAHKCSEITTPTKWPVYAHLPNNAATIWQGVEDRPWATGLYSYWPGPFGSAHARWDARWADAVARWPEGRDVLVSPKAVNDAALHDLIERLPESWRKRFVFAYYQEPEDNHTTPAERAAFRAVVKRAAGIVRQYGAKNAVHLQEWTLDPINNKAWRGAANAAAFIDPADIDLVSWSLYSPARDNSQQQIDRIVSFMAQSAPGVPWAATACGISVPDNTPANAIVRVQRADLVVKLIERLRVAGAAGFGWWDFQKFADLAGDNSSIHDPLLRDALITANK